MLFFHAQGIDLQTLMLQLLLSHGFAGGWSGEIKYDLTYKAFVETDPKSYCHQPALYCSEWDSFLLRYRGRVGTVFSEATRWWCSGVVFSCLCVMLCVGLSLERYIKAVLCDLCPCPKSQWQERSMATLILIIRQQFFLRDNTETQRTPVQCSSSQTNEDILRHIIFRRLHLFAIQPFLAGG